MRADNMPIDQTLYETVQHGHKNFPIQYYVDELYKFRNRRVPLHWHFEPQFYVSRGGVVRVQVGNHVIDLNPGCVIFINRNTLHSFEQIREDDLCECPNIIFSTELITSNTSILFQKYIKPIISNRNLPYFVLDPNLAWQKTIIDDLTCIFFLLQKYGSKGSYGSFPDLQFEIKNLNETCFEMEVQRRLNQIWQCIYSHLDQIPVVPQDSKELQYQVRLQQMIMFIQHDYMNPITLQDVSNSANISKSEALRCFQTYMKQSPIDYLIQYRLEVAQRLLFETNSSVQDISSECGFNSSSYFIKIFRNKIGITPREFRRQLSAHG
ncbi:AraC family transcriptional regulator [Paenibacillus polymyxa]|uniref:AraC family transcriptional regulator n=1 Tax=Paenibacillus polymyxa TaxID=1406 RepID=UPI002ED05A3C|nr:AraC family transcriptional regulator [Paenibacillus polymyxa]